MRLWDICTREYFPRRLAIRSDKTVRQYRFAVQDFGRFLGHEPTIADLTDDNLYGLAKLLICRGLAAKTVNERVGRIKTLWDTPAARPPSGTTRTRFCRLESPELFRPWKRAK